MPPPKMRAERKNLLPDFHIARGIVPRILVRLLEFVAHIHIVEFRLARAAPIDAARPQLLYRRRVPVLRRLVLRARPRHHPHRNNKTKNAKNTNHLAPHPPIINQKPPPLAKPNARKPKRPRTQKKLNHIPNAPQQKHHPPTHQGALPAPAGSCVRTLRTAMTNARKPKRPRTQKTQSPFQTRPPTKASPTKPPRRTPRPTGSCVLTLQTAKQNARKQKRPRTKKNTIAFPNTPTNKSITHKTNKGALPAPQGAACARSKPQSKTRVNQSVPARKKNSTTFQTRPPTKTSPTNPPRRTPRSTGSCVRTLQTAKPNARKPKRPRTKKKQSPFQTRPNKSITHQPTKAHSPPRGELRAHAPKSNDKRAPTKACASCSHS